MSTPTEDFQAFADEHFPSNDGVESYSLKEDPEARLGTGVEMGPISFHLQAIWVKTAEDPLSYSTGPIQQTDGITMGDVLEGLCLAEEVREFPTISFGGSDYIVYLVPFSR